MDKIAKIKKLADAMYYAAQHLTTDASRLHKAMDEYHKFIIHEYHKEEPVCDDLDKAARKYAGIPEDSPHDLTYCVQDKKAKYAAVLFGANWHMQKMMKDAKSGIGNYDNYIKLEDGTWIDLDPSMQKKPAFNVKEGEKVKVLVIKED